MHAWLPVLPDKAEIYIELEQKVRKYFYRDFDTGKRQGMCHECVRLLRFVPCLEKRY